MYLFRVETGGMKVEHHSLETAGALHALMRVSWTTSFASAGSLMTDGANRDGVEVLIDTGRAR
jgi:hypothetical protein